MKILNIISIVLVLSFINPLAAQDDSNSTLIQDPNLTEVNYSVLTDSDDNSSLQDNNSTIALLAEPKKLSEFEKLFVNHIAYNYYKKAITALYSDNYKSAYENAMRAKDIVDNTELNTSTIALPFMPSYVRETAYSPKRTYYKIVKEKEYKLKRLVVKAKLMSPPIASLVIHRTSTTTDIILRNHGDLPFDDFKVLVNDKQIALYEKLLPNEEKIIKINRAPKLYEVSFKEKYGFAPKSFMITEEY